MILHVRWISLALLIIDTSSCTLFSAFKKQSFPVEPDHNGIRITSATCPGNNKYDANTIYEAVKNACHRPEAKRQLRPIDPMAKSGGPIIDPYNDSEVPYLGNLYEVPLQFFDRSHSSQVIDLAVFTEDCKLATVIRMVEYQFGLLYWRCELDYVRVILNGKKKKSASQYASRLDRFPLRAYS